MNVFTPNPTQYMERITKQDKILYKLVDKIPLSSLLTNKPPKGKTHLIIEKKSKNILAFCSEDYNLRKNSNIFQPFEKLLKEGNITFKKNLTVIEGTKFYVDYVIYKNLNSNKIPDILPRISIWNSYDGTVSTQIKFGFFRLLCGNSLSRPCNCNIHASSKHSEDENSTIPQFFKLVNEFIYKCNTDIKAFEKLYKKPAKIDSLFIITDALKLSKETREVALKQLALETQGNITYMDENNKKAIHKGGKINMFDIYSAINYGIYHVNPKELPEIKVKKDKMLINYICDN